MTEQNIETRVGYIAIDRALDQTLDQTLDYIKAHTVNNIYVSNIEYLTKATNLRDYLKK